MAAKPEPKKPPLAISSLELSGIKSLYETQSIEIRPLTVLAGANSSGKSSMMQSLLLLKQTLEAPYDPGPLLIRGPNVDFTSTDQLLFHGTGGKERSKSPSLSGPRVAIQFDCLLSEATRVVVPLWISLRKQSQVKTLSLN